MRFQEIRHSADVVRDIQEIFTDEIHSIVFISQQAYEMLLKDKKISQPNCLAGNSYYLYREKEIKYFEVVNRMQRANVLIGIVEETVNMYMIVYFKTTYFREQQKTFDAVMDTTKKIVFLK